MTGQQIIDALHILTPGAEWTLTGDELKGLEWLDKKIARPNDEIILAEIKNPTPKPQPTIEQKLASIGLSVDSLKTALGL